MVRRNGLRWISLLLLAALPEVARAEDPPLGRQVGTVVGDFKLKDVATGKDVQLFSFAGKKGAVLVFLGVDCPVGNQYMPRLSELAKTYEAKGIVFLGINSNAHETAEQVAGHAREFGLNFPVLKDTGNKVADLYEAGRTCEAIVLDGHAHVVYRGAIDDQYGYGKSRPRPDHTFVADALDAVLDGKKPETTATSVVGCPIERVDAKESDSLKIPKIRSAAPTILEARKAEDEAAKVGPVDYASDVAAILQNKCQNCHRPKAAAPFSLLSYDDAKRWSGTIHEAVDDRRMPPWHADPRYGHFENDRSLSAKERATLLAWVDQGTPLGDPKKIPAAKKFSEGWIVGTPDVVFEMPSEYTVPAQGVLHYQRFRVPTNFTEDKWVTAIEPVPGDRSVVHHIIVYLDTKQKNTGRPIHLAGYAPGEMPSIYGNGVAKKIPAGSDLIFEIHYTPMGKIKTDRSRVGFMYAKGPVEHEAITQGITNMRFKIPPNNDNFEVKSRQKFAKDAHLLAFMPHMHLRGKDFEYKIIYPDGRTEILLSVPAYDFSWQSYYRLEKPLALPEGTTIECTAHFDNSSKNLANPDPSKEVGWGEQTWDEMMIGFIDYYRDEPVKATASNEKSTPAKP